MDEHPTPARRGARVLIADDSAVNRKILEAMLRSEGHEVVAVRDGQEAVEAFGREAPDIVFLDALMPRMDGREASRRIKSLSAGRLVPVVFITALEDDNDLESCVEAGADDFLTKPFDVAVLRAKLRLLLRMREIEQKARARDGELVDVKKRVREASSARPHEERKSRVLVIDDSALMCQVLSEILGRAGGLEVVGTARDAYAGWEKIQTLRPDVITLDVEMPRMDGLTFLEKLMRLRPMPVVMISSLTERGCQTTLRALELGAVDFVAKPRLDPLNGTMALAEHIVAKVAVAARARIAPLPMPAGDGSALPQSPAQVAAPRSNGLNARGLVAIGASTGGTRALELIFAALPADAPPIIAVQHMPEGFTARFAERLDGRCRITVREARDGEALQRGTALIAPGNQHVEVLARGGEFVVCTSVAPLVSGHRPSVDVLFRSVAKAAGANALGVLLTGMGEDGARGLLEMKTAGARTIAQDEASCVVFGMPKAAITLGAAQEVLSLDRMAGAFLEPLRKAA